MSFHTELSLWVWLYNVETGNSYPNRYRIIVYFTGTNGLWIDMVSKVYGVHIILSCTV